jgi:hypothetical protein
MDPDGSHPKNLTASLDRDVRSPHWSWDGKTIYFLVEDHGNTLLYSVDVETDTLKQVTSGVQQLGMGGGFTLANNAMIANVRSTPDSPGDVVVLPAYRQAAPVRVTGGERQPAGAISVGIGRGDHVRYLRREEHAGLDHQAARFRSLQEIRLHSRHPRRPAFHVRRGFPA